jgi:chromosome segregation ATPase
MTKKLSLLTLAFVLLLSAPLAVSAVTESPTTVTKTPSPTKAETSDVIKQLRENAQEKKQETKTQLMEEREEAKTAMQEKRKMTKEEAETKREEFKTKLEELKDTKKQSIVERVDEKINSLNERHTERLSTHLTRMTALLEKIKTRAEKSENTEVDGLIETAETAIEDAQAAVDEQKEMTYVIELGDEDEVKTIVQQTFMEFKNDIKEVHQKVKAAHEAIRDAARALGPTQKEDNAMMKEDDSDAATSEATVTP